MATANEKLRDTAIRHAIELGRYGNGLSNRVIRLLNSADADILEKIAGRLASIEERGFVLSARTRDQLAKLSEEIAALNTAIYDQLHEKLTEELTDFAAAEAGFQKAALDAAVSIDLGTKLPTPAFLRAIVEEAPFDGFLLASHVKGLAQGRIDRVNQAIRIGLVQGESTDAIVRRVRGSKALNYSDGVLDKSRRYADNVVRTATTHVSNQAAQATWKANEHVVKGWQFVATLDTRTTTTCAGLSGSVHPIGEGPIPPRHIRCRSISIGVTKSFRELGVDRDELTPGQRASMDGEVAADTTFGEWLVNKGAEAQDKILGPTRAKLFRDGKMNLQDFIKDTGEVLTLEQLQAKYPGVLN